ncbi:MAG TPA: diguanylate cyclase, partial [Thermoleophilia bacterium]|nr:diguanylate cyclase [Thermoleophilia bacterium]
WPPKDIIAELSHERDATRLWVAAGFTLSRLLDVPDCDLHRLDEDGELFCVASIRQGEWYPEHLGRSAHPTLRAIDREALSMRRSVVVSSPLDPRLSAAEHEEMLRWNERAKALVPLIAKDDVIGLAEIGEMRGDRSITADSVAAAESVCQLIAVAVHDAGVIDEQKLEARRLASLLESSRAVAGAKSTEDALAIVARRAVELFDVTSCIAYELEGDIDAIVARAIWEREPSGWSRLGEPLALADHPVEADLLASGGARLEYVSDRGLDPGSRASMEMWGEKSCLTVPMRSVDGPMGLLTLWDSTRERKYSDDEMALASSLAELAGEAVRSAKQLRRMRGLSETDALTGLANRRKIREFLALAQARAERYGTHFSLVMMDIDGFKSLNDTHGHPAGDAVLCQVARLLKERTRASDSVGRYGGDEFLLILPETTPSEACVLAEKLRAGLAGRPYVAPTGERIGVRASLGVAAYPHDGRDADELVGVADANLYVSKRRGGDAVTRSGESRPLRGDSGGELGSPLAVSLSL